MMGVDCKLTTKKNSFQDYQFLKKENANLKISLIAQSLKVYWQLKLIILTPIFLKLFQRHVT